MRYKRAKDGMGRGEERGKWEVHLRGGEGLREKEGARREWQSRGQEGRVPGELVTEGVVIL